MLKLSDVNVSSNNYDHIIQYKRFRLLQYTFVSGLPGVATIPICKQNCLLHFLGSRGGRHRRIDVTTDHRDIPGKHDIMMGIKLSSSAPEQWRMGIKLSSSAPEHWGWE